MIFSREHALPRERFDELGIDFVDDRDQRNVHAGGARALGDEARVGAFARKKRQPSGGIEIVRQKF